MKKYPDITTTAMFAEAVAQARIDSHRYWAKRGAADKEYPCLPTPGWKIARVDDGGARNTADAIKRHRGNGTR